MYRVSPFSYLVGGMLATGVANTDVTCSSIEVLVVDPIAGQNCSTYFKSYMDLAGGSLTNPGATSGCEFCSIASTNVFLADINIFVRIICPSQTLVYAELLKLVFTTMEKLRYTLGFHWLQRHGRLVLLLVKQSA